MLKSLKDILDINKTLSQIPLNYETWVYEETEDGLLVKSQRAPAFHGMHMEIMFYKDNSIDMKLYNCFDQLVLDTTFIPWFDQEGMVRTFIEHTLTPAIQSYAAELERAWEKKEEEEDDDIEF